MSKMLKLRQWEDIVIINDKVYGMIIGVDGWEGYRTRLFVVRN